MPRADAGNARTSSRRSCGSSSWPIIFSEVGLGIEHLAHPDHTNRTDLIIDRTPAKRTDVVPIEQVVRHRLRRGPRDPNSDDALSMGTVLEELDPCTLVERGCKGILGAGLEGVDDELEEVLDTARGQALRVVKRSGAQIAVELVEHVGTGSRIQMVEGKSHVASSFHKQCIGP